MSVNLKGLTFVNGVAVCWLAAVMAIPLTYDMFLCAGNCVALFLFSIGACIFWGGLMVFSCRTRQKPVFSQKDSFLLVISLWCVVSIISSLPFYFYQDVSLSFMASLFESVSGITTTGATIYPDVEILPDSLNLWRFILHFIGGVGIVAIGIIILPTLRFGGMQLFLAENSNNTEKFLPKASQIVRFFAGTYVILILIFAILLRLSGMTKFDSICHSISSISTGGFSTKNAGISWYKSGIIKFVISIAMFVGGLAFLELARCFKGKCRHFFKIPQIRGYLKIITCMIIFPLIAQAVWGEIPFTFKRVSEHILRVMSAVTTTGYYYADSDIAPPIIFIIIAMIGGCAGSTTGGFKIFRIQILYAVVKQWIRKTASRYEISIPKYMDQKITESMTISIITVLALYVFTFIISATILWIITSNDTLTCCHSVLSCLFNLGFEARFSTYSPGAHLIFVCDMILGRLEILPVFVIISKGFWTR
jgi:trk system potassium uptake protein TrkH